MTFAGERAPDDQRIFRRALLTDEELVEDVFGGSREYDITGVLRTWKCFIPQRHRENF